MSRFIDYFEPLENPLVTQAREKEAAYHRDLGNMFVEWAEGGIKGAEEVGRAASYLGATLTPDQIKERLLSGLTEPQELTEEQQESLKWYDRATDTFKEETARPVFSMAPAFFGIAGLPAAAPFIINDTMKEAEQNGYSSALVKTAKNMVPIYGTVSEDGFSDYAEDHPLRAIGSVALDAADVLHPAVQTARMVRKNYLITKGKKTPSEAEQIVKGEFDLQDTKAAPETPKEPSKPKSILERLEHPEDTEVQAFKPTKLKGEEVYDPPKNPDVSKKIGKIIDEGYRVSKELEEDMQPFRGANGVEIVAAPTDYPHPVTINGIWKTANEITPVRQGRLRTKRAKGYFEITPEGIRIKGFRDFDVMAHEIGHFLDKKFKIEGFDDELINGVKTGRLKDAGYKAHQYRSEGIAEFTATYMLNPEQAKSLYPGYFDAFTQKLAENPKMQKKVDQLSNQIRKWSHQSETARVRGSIEFDGDDQKSLGQELKDKAVAVKDNIEQNWFDRTTHLNRTVKTFEEITGTKVEFKDNPVETARAIENTIPARIEMILGLSKLPSEHITKVLGEVYHTKLHKVTLADVYKTLDDLAINKKYPEYLKENGLKDWHEGFSTFMNALHTLEVDAAVKQERLEAFQTVMDELKNKLDNAVTPEEKADVLTQIAVATNEYKNLPEYSTAAELSDYKATVQKAPKEFLVAAKKLKDFNENRLNIMVATGYMKAADADLFKKKYPHYVPLQRSSAIEQGGSSIAGRIKNSYVNLDKAFKVLDRAGSERVVKDPISEMVTQTCQMINNVERNRLGQQIVKMAKSEGGSMIAIEAGGQGANATKRDFTVWIDGKAKTYTAVAPGLYEVLATADKASASIYKDYLKKLGTTSANILRVGATSTPAYMLWSLIKDGIFAGLSTQTGKAKVPILGGLYRSFQGLDTFYRGLDKYMLAQFEAQGVPFSTFIGSNKDVTQKLRKMAGNTPKYQDNLIYQGLAAFINKLQDISHAVEMAPRITEFERALAQGKTPEQAGAMARDLTIDFSRAGTEGRAFNQYTAFFNAAVQGTNKVYRMLREKPIETLMTGVATLTLPTLAYWSWVRDKDWYKDLPFEDKMRYWYWEATPDVIFKIPKPELIGFMFASVPEQILNTIYENDRNALLNSNLDGFMLSSTMPNVVPTGAIPIVEWFFNYDTFRGHDLVSPHELKKEAPDQYNLYTSEVAKGLGRATNLSPIHIDNAMRDLTGSLGSFFLGVIDSMVKDNETPEKKLTDMTRFTLPQGSSRTRTADVFYNGLDRLEKKYNSSNNKKFVREHKGMQKALRDVNKVRKKINQVLYNERLSGAEKRAKIDILNKKINAIQRRANQRYLGYKYIQSPK